MQMDERKQRILSAIIDDYILTAMPVGSRTITEKYHMGLSSATIRNEMNDLEELGYLNQPHVSAGRVPSAKAYRLYVDLLLARGDIQSDDAQSVREFFTKRVHRMEDVVRSAAQALSDMTRYTAVVMSPKQLELRVNTLQLVPVTQSLALLVIVTDGGIVRDTMLHVSSLLDSDALYAISRMLTERLSGHTLRQVRQILTEYMATSGADRHVLAGISELTAQMEKQSRTDTVTVGGSHNILNYPEYSDVDKARTFLSLLDAKDTLMRLMQPDENEPYTVRIGPENGVPELQYCTLIAAPYRMGRRYQGAIGVIGPTRMPYKHIIGVLGIVGQTLSDILQTQE